MRTQYITSIGLFNKNVEKFWRVSDCEELSGGYSQEMMGLVLGESKIYHQLVVFSIMGDLNRKVVIK